MKLFDTYIFEYIYICYQYYMNSNGITISIILNNLSEFDTIGIKWNIISIILPLLLVLCYSWYLVW